MNDPVLTEPPLPSGDNEEEGGSRLLSGRRSVCAGWYGYWPASYLFCPDQIIGHANPYRLFQVTTADGTIEGVVKSIANGKLIIATQTCPPEATAACKKSERAVTLDPGAEYHINGVVGFAAEKKPDAAVNFTHLRFTVLEGERGLGRGISELRFVVGDKELGPGTKASGDNGFETMFDGNNRTLVKWKSGRNAAITCDD